MTVFLFLCQTLVFLFLPFLNLGTQRCLPNLYTDLIKSALDQPLNFFGILKEIYFTHALSLEFNQQTEKLIKNVTELYNFINILNSNGVGQLAYTVYVCVLTFIGVHMILDMCMLTLSLIFSLWFFKVVKTFLILIISYCLKTYCYVFDVQFFVYVLRRDRRCFTGYISFKETIFSNFLYELFNKYFSLLQSTCQFKVSVRK